MQPPSSIAFNLHTRPFAKNLTNKPSRRKRSHYRQQKSCTSKCLIFGMLHHSIDERDAPGETIAARQRNSQAIRLRQAVDNVHQHRVDAALRDAAEAHSNPDETKVSTRMAMAYADSVDLLKKQTQSIDKMVDDMIKNAMARGEFDNLKGVGKPLKMEEHQFLDTTTTKLNQVLINSGVLPEWINADKELREILPRLRQRTLDVWRSALQSLGTEDPRKQDESEAEHCTRIAGTLAKLEQALVDEGIDGILALLPLRQRQDLLSHREELLRDVAVANKKIASFNLIAPLLTQQKLLFDEARALRQHLAQCRSSLRRE
ncbi:hypothetical protein CAOG_01472 [Capsaspora owczarzaki ATCC 30864]|uniref:DnaJ homologue subfamily C member 28 conserved domain-containing protein n=1 Tax=Capsaspora owczarzaki (strain ATCC 30864) TaxID=595528 RepID=A0A0D2VJJ0_CAPO3|nr:hypothetical protein CAOG_01472 [Capsaspora owczarzaki ATCC 30864]KJE90122.1 hypothetical protein CAOG_001472 [Capsaspora owczarzaki ATCC 30864]|eukprot:XP_004364340.2 hypothetical protein CAOG_01472 [Capsaspora owczarzaki ATCC 30864]